MLDGKVQNYLPYNGVFPGKINTKSFKVGAFVKASVTKFPAGSLSLANLWKWQSPNQIPMFVLNSKIKLFFTPQTTQNKHYNSC